MPTIEKTLGFNLAVKTEIGKKFDNDKPMMNLLPFEALEEVAKVLTYGANKYGKDNALFLVWFEKNKLKERV